MKHLHCQDLELVNVIVKLLCWLVDVWTFDKSEFETPSQMYCLMIGEKGCTYQCFLANFFWFFATLLKLNCLAILSLLLLASHAAFHLCDVSHVSHVCDVCDVYGVCDVSHWCDVSHVCDMSHVCDVFDVSHVRDVV